jgi:hypothetical protein
MTHLYYYKIQNLSTTPSLTTQKNLLYAGIAFAIAGFIIVLIPVVQLGGDIAAEKMADIAGWVVFAIGIFMLIAFAAFYINRHR